jgi:hypothetical protein
MSRYHRRKFYFCFLPFPDVCFFDQVDRLDFLEISILVDLEVGDAQVIDEGVSLEYPDGNFNVDDRDIVLDFLGEKNQTVRKKADYQE